MVISAAGKRKFAAFGGIIVLDIVVLALSIRVNVFQGFFFVADLFPLLLSIITLSIFLLSIILELTAFSAFTAYPMFEIPLLSILTFIWLGFNAFSTSRWNNLPSSCSSIPNEYRDIRGWCQNVQALKAVIWLMLVALATMTLSLLYFVFTQARGGNNQIWRTPLSRHGLSTPKSNSVQFIAEVSSYYRGSSLFDFRLRTSFGAGGKGNSSPSSRDFFAPPSPVFRNSVSSSAFGGGRAGVGAYSPSMVGLGVPGSQLSDQFRPETNVPKGFEIVSGGTLEDGVWDGSTYPKPK